MPSKDSDQSKTQTVLDPDQTLGAVLSVSIVCSGVCFRIYRINKAIHEPIIFHFLVIINQQKPANEHSLTDKTNIWAQLFKTNDVVS